MSSVACCNTDWGMVGPRASAVARLIMRSKVVGRSIGRSAQGPLQDLVHVHRTATVHIGVVGPVAHQATVDCELPPIKARRQVIARASPAMRARLATVNGSISRRSPWACPVRTSAMRPSSSSGPRTSSGCTSSPEPRAAASAACQDTAMSRRPDPEHGHAAEPRDRLPEQVEPLGGELVAERGEAGHVAARPREAGQGPVPDEIDRARYLHDRDGVGRVPSGQSRRRARRHDGVTGRRTSSAIIAGRGSSRPSATRSSMTMFRPSA